MTIKVTLRPIPATEVKSGDRVRFSYHEQSCDVQSAMPTTSNGEPSIVFKVRGPVDLWDIYAAPDHTVWLVEAVPEPT